jgi:hypothetical protein
MEADMRWWAGILVAGLVASSCGGDGPTGTATSSTTTIAVDAGGSLFPAERPDDFRASFSQDGGMVPWSESINISAEAAAYEVFIEGTTIGIDWVPIDERLDVLYNEIVDGRFDLYEFEPFEGDEMVYDAEGESYLVTAGGERHRLSASGETLLRPDVEGAPLSAISKFAQIEEQGFAHSAEIVISSELLSNWHYEFWFDFGEAQVAIGPERNTDRLTVYFDGPLNDVTVAYGFQDEDLARTTVTFVDFRTVMLGLDSGEAFVQPLYSDRAYVDYVFEVADGFEVDLELAAARLDALLYELHGARPTVRIESGLLILGVLGDAALLESIEEFQVPVIFAPVLVDGEPLSLGEPSLDGDIVESAGVSFGDTSGWVVGLVLREGTPGIDDFNELASRCVNRDATCPTGRLAISVDGEVVTAPTVNATHFDRDAISISGSFDEAEALALASQISAAAVTGLELVSTSVSR